MIELKIKIDCSDGINLSHGTIEENPNDLEKVMCDNLMLNIADYFTKLAKTMNKLEVEDNSETQRAE